MVGELLSHLYDFDLEINRVGSDCIKYDSRGIIFGSHDVMPAWIADMDFPIAKPIQLALEKRLQHPFFGYTQLNEKLYEVTQKWLLQHQGWKVERDWIVLCPGVIPSLSAAVLAFSELKKNVIIQPPVYQPFSAAVLQSNRTLKLNPLVCVKHRYEINFNHLEECASQSELMLFCSPHNPVGRVWSQGEIERVIDIACKYNLIIMSDEIHSDLIYSESKFVSVGQIANGIDNVVIARSPCKTFNIPGLNLSCVIIPNKMQRDKFSKVFSSVPINLAHPLNIQAYLTAYGECTDWVQQLLVYLEETRNIVYKYINVNLPQVKICPTEGTFLMWLDFKALGLSDEELHRFLIEKAKVGLSPGTLFGHEGRGFMRLNFAAPRKSILKILERIKSEIDRKF